MRMEQTILKNLIYHEEFTRKVLPFLKEEYFTDRNEKILFSEITNYISKYNSNPTFEALVIQLNDTKITEEDYSTCVETLKEFSDSKNDLCKLDWLVDNTEKFCQDKAIYNAVLSSISILDGKDKSFDKGAIPDILSKALSVGFDSSVGHDYIDDYEDRYEFYHKEEEKIPFDLDYMNRITRNGLSKKSLNILLAATGAGKSLFKCHVASNVLSQGKNVLYITMEMAEEKIAERIDANLLNVAVDDLSKLSKEEYTKKIQRLKSKNVGKLIIKEYPTASASVIHFRNLLNELNLKRNFVPDLIIVDYLNICASSRVKLSSSVNSYTFVKSIAEEIRGLAVEFDVPILTSSQLNRSGAVSSDPTVENVSESFGIAATADLIIALISTEELEQLNQIMVKQIKNRYADPTKNKRFVIGVDRSKMRLYDTDASAQNDISDSGQEQIMQKSFAKSFSDKKPQFNDFKF